MATALQSANKCDQFTLLLQLASLSRRLVLVPVLPVLIHEIIHDLPISARMRRPNSLILEVARFEITWLQCDVRGAQHPLPEIGNAVMGVLDPRFLQPVLDDALEVAQAMQLVDHADGHGTPVGTQALRVA